MLKKISKGLIKAALFGAIVVFTTTAAYLYASIAYDIILKSKKEYSLVLLTYMGPQPVPVGKLLVTNPQPQADGSLCFTSISDDKHVCIKFPGYELAEIELE